MGKKPYGLNDWLKFRDEILDLIVIYSHLREYESLEKKYLELAPVFIHNCRIYTLRSLIVKFGFLLTNGKPTFIDFLDNNEFIDLKSLYEGKVKLLRDQRVSHNVKYKDASLELTCNDIEILFNKLIQKAKGVDDKFGENFNYDFVHEARGISSLIPILDDSIELESIKEYLYSNNCESVVRINPKNNKIDINVASSNKK